MHANLASMSTEIFMKNLWHWKDAGVMNEYSASIQCPHYIWGMVWINSPNPRVEKVLTCPLTSTRIDLTKCKQFLNLCCSSGLSFAVLIKGSMSKGYLVILVVTVKMHSGMPIFLKSGLLLHCWTNSWNLLSFFIISLYIETASKCWEQNAP